MAFPEGTLQYYNETDKRHDPKLLLDLILNAEHHSQPSGLKEDGLKEKCTQGRSSRVIKEMKSSTSRGDGKDWLFRSKETKTREEMIGLQEHISRANAKGGNKHSCR